MAPRPHVLVVAAGLALALFYQAWEPLCYLLSSSSPEEDTLTLGLVIGSERRAGNSVGVGAFVAATIRSLPLSSLTNLSPPHTSTSTSTPRLVLDIVDLASLALPRTFEFAPQRMPRNVSIRSSTWHPPEYDRGTRGWSARVRRFDAVLFVTPEYNGGIPGILKTALDRLYWEWGGVPAAVITLGAGGGTRAAAGAKIVLEDLGMEVLDGASVVMADRGRIRGNEEWLKDTYGDKVESVVRRLLVTAVRRRRAAREGGVQVDADIGGVEIEQEGE